MQGAATRRGHRIRGHLDVRAAATPVRATDVTIADNPLELVLVFSHVHFLAQPDGLHAEGAPCAAVALPWVVAKRLRDALNRQIDAQEEQMRTERWASSSLRSFRVLPDRLAQFIEALRLQILTPYYRADMHRHRHATRLLPGARLGEGVMTTWENAASKLKSVTDVTRV